MTLGIRARGLELSRELREQVVRRLSFALSRLSPALRRVDVTLADVNGPRGGVDKLCRIRARGPGLADIVIEERHAEIGAAVDLAAKRTARTLVRTLDRTRLVAGWSAP